MRTPDGPLRGTRTVVRPATLSDADMLVAWHADPDVASYWDGETFTRTEMIQRLQRPDVDPYIVEAEGVPIGYIQAWYEEEAPGRAGLDMFLVPSARDQGLGPDAARALSDWLLGPGEMDRVTADPYISRERAVRSWAKAGFETVGQGDPDEEHTQPWISMIRRR